MQLGDRLKFTPSAFTLEKSGALPGRKPLTRQVTGQVIYLHPERRYFTLEAMVNGYAIRESFQRKADVS